MTFKAHFLLIAKYNLRMNRQVMGLASELDSAILLKDKGAFFGSILGTLNHIFVGDLIWLKRFSCLSERYRTLINLADFPQPQALNDELFLTLDSYRDAREKLDQAIIYWISNEVIETDFEQSLVYANMKGVKSERNFGALLSHLFNHQTHHRGQVSNLLNQEGLDIGVTDFLMEIPDTNNFFVY